MAAKIDILNPRYRVEEVSEGFEIVDSTGKDKPYLLTHHNFEDPDPEETEVERVKQHRREIAEEWCYKWNIVEMGYCGSCHRKIAEGERAWAATGFNVLYKWICFECSCSQED